MWRPMEAAGLTKRVQDATGRAWRSLPLTMVWPTSVPSVNVIALMQARSIENACVEAKRTCRSFMSDGDMVHVCHM